MFVLSEYVYIYYFIIFYIHRAILTQINEKKPLIEKKTCQLDKFIFLSKIDGENFNFQARLIQMIY